MENTIDMALWEMLQHKQAIATEVLNPEEAKAAAEMALAEGLISV